MAADYTLVTARALCVDCDFKRAGEARVLEEIAGELPANLIDELVSDYNAGGAGAVAPGPFNVKFPLRERARS